uniref:Uncharacterized protein n=1 Tax=Eutreptiella gymnastica TaxID=73025 RepID=A0A7S1NHP8_9EUGL|mmetsp:Transcript_32415/g.58108  ORF Transcript_32415/g.58108 Transcript_32415/m.58108 type:complete len:149 (+) Transcript_32415:30-476(+)
MDYRTEKKHFPFVNNADSPRDIRPYLSQYSSSRPFYYYKNGTFQPLKWEGKKHYPFIVNQEEHNNFLRVVHGMESFEGWIEGDMQNVGNQNVGKRGKKQVPQRERAVYVTTNGRLHYNFSDNESCRESLECATTPRWRQTWRPAAPFE